MADLLGILSFCGNLNLPGVSQINYAPVDWIDVDAYEELVSDDNYLKKEITFTTGTWLTAPVFEIQQNWEERPRTDKQGTPYDQIISAVVPSVRPAVTGEFAKMADRPFIVYLTDRNGNPWIIGTPEHGLLFEAPAKTGRAGEAGMNDYRIRWRGVTARRAFGYAPVL